MHTYRHTGHHRYAGIPVEARPLGDDSLGRDERLPSLVGVALIERATVLHVDGGDDLLPAAERGPEVPLNWFGQADWLARVIRLGPNWAPGKVQPGTQLLRTGLPTTGCVNKDHSNCCCERDDHEKRDPLHFAAVPTRPRHPMTA